MTDATCRMRKGRLTSICLLHFAICILTASVLHAGSQAVVSHAALATSSPVATQVGLRVLQGGGNAIDAAVAVALTLAVVQPQSGNIGGGGFMTYYDAETRGVWTLDFREAAPLASKRDMFANASPRLGAIAAAVPGTIAGLDAMHARFGSRPWKELVTPAVRLARGGVKVDSDLSFAIATAKAERKIDNFPTTAALFFRDGKPIANGATLVESELAATLERIADKGARDFYEGEIAKRLIDEVHAAGGVFVERDLRDYKPIWRAPVRITFRNYDIYSVAPPAAGGLVIGETLKILGAFDLAASGFQTPKTLHLLAEAERRASIDRNKYLGDPTAGRIPLRELLSDERAALWRASIDPRRVTPTMSLTEPAAATTPSNHTTHFTIVDARGNMAAVTITLGDALGGGYVLPGLGFLLNDAMNDFAMAPNEIGSGRRPASPLSPTIVLRDNKPFLALGTPGGATIPTTIVQVLLNLLVFKQSLPAAIAAPRYHHQGVPEEIFYEQARAPKETIDKLLAMGHAVKERDAIGDVEAIMIDRGKLIAIADPRHAGAAGGY